MGEILLRPRGGSREPGSKGHCFRSKILNPNQQNETNEARLLRLSEVLHLIAVARSSWWQGVREGRYPAPVKLGERTTRWRFRDIVELAERGVTAPSKK